MPHGVDDVLVQPLERIEVDSDDADVGRQRRQGAIESLGAIGQRSYRSRCVGRQLVQVEIDGISGGALAAPLLGQVAVKEACAQ